MNIWIEIRAHLRERFHERLTEWEHALMLTLWGWILLQPHEVFESRSYVAFRGLGEDAWGFIMLALGLLRFAGLIVNGARKRITPWMRALAAGIGFAIFAILSLGFASAGTWGTAMAIYPVVALFELFNFGRAMRDVGKSNGLA